MSLQQVDWGEDLDPADASLAAGFRSEDVLLVEIMTVRLTTVCIYISRPRVASDSEFIESNLVQMIKEHVVLETRNAKATSQSLSGRHQNRPKNSKDR